MKKDRIEVIALKELLPYGGIKLIAVRTGLSYRMVQYVLTGKHKNKKVVNAAIEIIREDNQRKREFLLGLLKLISLE